MDEIQTEVDRLIEILQARPGKAVRMGELADLTNLDMGQVRKWIHILEERRQVEISYSLSDEVVEWKGTSAIHMGKPSHPTDQQGISTNQNISPSSESAIDSNMEAAHFNEQRFRQHPKWKAATKHDDSEGYPPKDVQSIIEKSMEESARRQAQDEHAQNERIYPSRGQSTRSARRQVSEPALQAEPQRMAEPQPEPQTEPALPPLPKMNEQSMRISSKLKSKIAAARSKMEEIEKLKGEKKRLLVEIYRPMETKLEAETGAITEKLIELENQLLGIREQAATVPAEVAELAGEQERIVQIAAEMRRVYSETDRQMTQSVQALSNARQMAHTRVQEANAIILQQQDALTQMNQQEDILAEAREQAQTRIEQAQQALASQEAHLTTMQENMHMIVEFQQQMQQRTQQGTEEIARQRAALADIDRQLGRMDEVQSWVETHRAEYNNRMSKLNGYIQNAGTEYNKLKAAIDSGFIHRYLRDLRALSESYQFELTQAQQLETNVDQRLEETKKELSALIAQAREVADAQELSMAQSAPKPIDAIEYDDGHERAVQDVNALQGERVKLREQIRRTLNDEDEMAEHDEKEGETPVLAVEVARPSLTPRSHAHKRAKATKASKGVKKKRAK